MQRGDVSAAVFALFLAIIYAYKILQLETRGFTSGELGPQVFPTILVIIFASLALLLLIKGLIKGDDQKHKTLSSKERINVVLCIFFLITYFFALTQFGYMWTTPLFLAIFVWLYGGRSLIVIVGASLVPSVVIYLFFRKIFNVLLP
jgi:hypothetical protein